MPLTHAAFLFPPARVLSPLDDGVGGAPPTATPLEDALGYRFRDRALLARALTHRSAHPAHNERLEFLGDAVLALGVSALLVARYADSDEGDLTRVRAHLVREEALHGCALAIGLPQHLHLSDGEARAGGAQRPSILADAMEAVLGAVFRDGGYEAAEAVVTTLFGPIIDSTDVRQWGKDAKTALQEWLQARRLPVPQYRILSTVGQAHAQTFEVECAVAAYDRATKGSGRSRRVAEQEAAQRMLALLEGDDARIGAGAPARRT